MSTQHLSRQNKLWPWLAIFVVIGVTIYQLHSQGRLWWCACDQIWLWAGDIWSSDNSQHLFDPYSFTHLLHGFAFYWLLAWGLPRLSPLWRLWLALSIEAVWEMIENSNAIIQRYRDTTLALGYQGDTIVNTMGDLLMCGLGFMLARQLGFKRTVILFIVTELVLLVWIRDGLVLNIIMLIYPIEAVKAWQMGY